MRTRTFSEEEKEEIKRQMVEAGLPLLKEEGLIHMSITKLTQAVGIGKSTFYNFYSSKEDFVEDMLKHHRRKLMQQFEAGLDGKKRYSKKEGKKVIRNMIVNANNLYGNFSIEDEKALKKFKEKSGTLYLNLEYEKEMIQYITSFMEGVKEELDYSVISNITKIIVFTAEQKALLHEAGYERTINILVNLLLDNIFEKEVLL